MGSVTYNFLANSILFDQRNIDDKFKNVSANRIEKEIQAYREHCINNYGVLIGEINKQNSLLSVFSSSKDTPLSLLKQTALYIDQFIISDPLFALTDTQSEMTAVMSQYLGYSNDKGINKVDLARHTSFLKEITPMIAGNFVKIFPLNYHFERPKDSIPLNMPVDYYNGILPKNILEFFRQNVDVKSMKKDKNGGWYIQDKLELCRAIMVEFKGANLSSNLIYHLLETTITEFDEKTGKAKFKQYLPETLPSIQHFNAWVTQSINSTSKTYFDRVFFESYLASNLNCTYLCDNSFTAELISNNFNVKEDIQTFTANQMMNFELPFIEAIDTKKLMSLRNFEEDTFTTFRVELEKNMRELRNITDEKQIQLKLENTFHELNSVQVQKIKQKVNLFKKQMGVSALIGIGGLAGIVTTGGLSLLAAAVALGRGFKDYLDYREKVIENPAYLLWKVKKNK